MKKQFWKIPLLLFSILLAITSISIKNFMLGDYII